MRASCPRPLDERAVAEATPLSRQRKLSATRSAVRMPRAGPRSRATVSPGATRAPSGRSIVEDDRGIDQAERQRRQIEPGDDAGLARDDAPSSSRRSAGAIASVVMSPARPRSSSSAARTIGSIRIVGRGAASSLSPPLERRRRVRAARRAPRRAQRRATRLGSPWPESRFGNARRGSLRAAARRARSSARRRRDRRPARAAERQRRQRADGGARDLRPRASPPRRRTGSAATALGSAAGGGWIAREAAPRARSDAPATLSATSPAKTTASVRELLARRLAPCRPVEATSPHAHRPRSELRPSSSTAIPPM